MPKILAYNDNFKILVLNTPPTYVYDPHRSSTRPISPIFELFSYGKNVNSIGLAVLG